MFSFFLLQVTSNQPLYPPGSASKIYLSFYSSSSNPGISSRHSISHLEYFRCLLTILSSTFAPFTLHTVIDSKVIIMSHHSSFKTPQCLPNPTIEFFSETYKVLSDMFSRFPHWSHFLLLPPLIPTITATNGVFSLYLKQVYSCLRTFVLPICSARITLPLDLHVTAFFLELMF